MTHMRTALTVAREIPTDDPLAMAQIHTETALDTLSMA